MMDRKAFYRKVVFGNNACRDGATFATLCKSGNTLILPQAHHGDDDQSQSSSSGLRSKHGSPTNLARFAAGSLFEMF